VSSDLSHSVVTSDDCSRTTDDDFDDQPSPAELSNLCKVANIHIVLRGLEVYKLGPSFRNFLWLENVMFQSFCV